MRTSALALLALAGCAPALRFVPGPGGRPAPPLIVDPKPDAVITDVRPPITLAIPPGTDVAHVELCRDARCESLIRVFDAQGNRATPPNDLESGVYYLRASAKAGSLFSQAGPTQKLTLELRTRVETARFVLEGPREARPTLERLAALCEKLLDRYRAVLGTDTPTRKLRVSLYATAEGYHVATDRLVAGKLADHVGFTHYGDAHIHWTALRLDRAVLDAVGGLERTVAHELVHQLYHTSHLHRRGHLPPWLSEAEADYLAVHELAAIYGIDAAVLAQQWGREEEARKALDEGYLIPVGQFLEADYSLWQSKFRRSVALFYSEGYSLLQSLAATADVAPLLHDGDALEADAARTINSMIHRRFGDDRAIGQRLEAWLRATPRWGWHAVGLEVRSMADGAIHLESPRRRTGELYAIAPLRAGTISAELTPLGETRGCVVSIGGYEVRLQRDGTLELWQKAIRGARLARAEGIAKGTHTLAVRFDAHQAIVEVDGAERLRGDLAVAPAGHVAIGVIDGQVIVKRLAASPAAP